MWWAAEGRAISRARWALQLQHLDLPTTDEPFAAIILATADRQKVDKRTRSKWSRVLRYSAEYKSHGESLAAFIRRKGGINECAARFIRCLGRGDRSWGAELCRGGGMCWASKARVISYSPATKEKTGAQFPEAEAAHRGGLFGQGNDLLFDVRMAQAYPPLSGSSCIATKTMVKSRTLQAVAPTPAFMASSRENDVALVFVDIDFILSVRVSACD
jgi:hypothetical protein